MNKESLKEPQKPADAIRRRRNGRSALGMTLVEIMVVLTIIGLVMGAVAVAVVPRLKEARVERAKLDIKNIQSGLTQYYARKGKYPDTGAGLKALVDTQIFDKAPTDPWGNEYVYTLEANRPKIVSYGADGQPGGEDDAADVTSDNVDAEAKSKQ